MTTLYEGKRVISEHYDEQAKIMTRYIEKPVEEVHIKEVPKITYIDVIKQVPDVKIETVERIVEEVCIEEVIKEVPVCREEEIIKRIPVKKVVEVPVERVREVPVDKITTREEIVEIPGDIIETERVYDIQKPLVIPRYKDTSRPMVYRQLIKPIIKQVGSDATGPGAPYEVDVRDYDPVLCKVLIHIPKPVKLPLVNLGAINSEHRWLKDVKDYDHLVRRCNPHLGDNQLTGLLSGDDLIQPMPDIDLCGMPVIGNSPLPGTFPHGLVSPQRLPPGKPADPRPLLNATYVNGIAREYSQLRGKANPHMLPAISALKELRKYRYADPEYEKYLKQHHQYFSQSARMIDPVFDEMIRSSPMYRATTTTTPLPLTNGMGPKKHTNAGRSQSTSPLPARPSETAQTARPHNRSSRGIESAIRELRARGVVALATSRSSTTSPHHRSTRHINPSPRHRIRSACRAQECPIHRGFF